MKCKMPSVKGEKHMEYLGHFKQDKWIQKGHNDIVKRIFGDSANETGKRIAENLRKAAQGGEGQAAETEDESNRRCSKLQGQAAQDCYDNARAARAARSK